MEEVNSPVLYVRHGIGMADVPLGGPRLRVISSGSIVVDSVIDYAASGTLRIDRNASNQLEFYLDDVLKYTSAVRANPLYIGVGIRGDGNTVNCDFDNFARIP